METESGDGTAEVNFGESERECRICQLGLGSSGDQSIDLGCSCKGDLAAAHKNCAEDWFNIRGDRYLMDILSQPFLLPFCLVLSQHYVGKFRKFNQDNYEITIHHF